MVHPFVRVEGIYITSAALELIVYKAGIVPCACVGYLRYLLSLTFVYLPSIHYS